MAKRKEKEEKEKVLGIKSMQEIIEESTKKKHKEKYLDYKNDNLTAQRADILSLIEEDAIKFNNDSIDLKKEFLIALSFGNSIKATAQVLGVTRQRIYKLKDKDAAFSDCMDDILKQLDYSKVIDVEDELMRKKEILNTQSEELWNNGLFTECLQYQKEANLVLHRFITRRDQKQAHKQEMEIAKQNKTKEQRIIVEHHDKTKTVAPDDYK